jgi:hypothetical protein
MVSATSARGTRPQFRRCNQAPLSMGGQLSQTVTLSKSRVIFSRLACSPAAYRREALIGSFLYKKLLNLFSLFVNIFLKHNLNGIKGCFLLQSIIFY